jgi:uncharacterized repeat protein (TIGR01451 family)
MFKKFLSLLISVIILLGQPLIVLAQVDFFTGYENLPAGGTGFFKLPSEEIPGQVEAYMLRGAGGAMWVTQDAIWMTQIEDLPLLLKNERRPNQVVSGVNIKVSFPGANPSVNLEAEQRMPGYVSILKGEDPSDWAAELPLWGLIRYRHLYPGVDLVIRSTDEGFEWEYEVDESADLNQLRLWVQGADDMMQDTLGTVLETSVGEMRLPALGLEGQESELRSDGTTRLVYDQWIEIYPQEIQSRIQNLDPETRLKYSTYLGGSGREYGSDVALDAQNNVYVAGETVSTDFPVNTGDTTLDSTDAFVAKFNMAVSPPALAYATYMGGNGIDRASGIEVEDGIAYVIGDTDSSDFPLAGDTNDVDVFAVAINESGSGLNYARLIGGSDPIGEADDYGYAIAVENNNAYLTGISYSDNFPVTNGEANAVNGDVFITKLNNQGATLYSTLLGGRGVDAGYGVDVSNGIAWVTGETDSDDFIARVSDSGVFVISLTGIGLLDTARVFDGTLYERGFDLALDSSGDIFVTGFTKSADFPVTDGSNYAGGLNDAFLLILDQKSTLYSTYLGGSGSDHGIGVAVDASGGVVVVGDTYSTDFPVTDDAYQGTYAGAGDVFLTRYFLGGDDPGFRRYSTYLGGIGVDNPKAIDMDGLVTAFIVGDTYSTDFPVTTDAYDLSANGSLDAFLSAMVVAPLPAVQIEKSTNGLDSDAAPGAYLLPDTPITWSYHVTNNGGVPLESIAVTDSEGVEVDCGGITTLGAGQSMDCTATGLAAPNQYGNLGTVTAYDPLLDLVVSDVDASHYFGVVPATSLVKLTNDQDVDIVGEVYIEVNDNVTWTYVIENTGNVTLTGVSVVDDQMVAITCPKDSLEPGESMTCSANGQAIPGQYENTGTVTGTPPIGPDVTDSDLSHYFGSDPSISIVKSVNGVVNASGPGLFIPVGDPVIWNYELHNTGNVPLTNVTVVDDPGTPGDPSDDITVCSGVTLQPDPDPLAFHTCSNESTAAAGQYYNSATVSGIPPVGSVVSATDDSYYFGAAPAILLDKQTNGQNAATPPGVYILVGSQVDWTYRVENSGNVPLTNVTVIDNMGVTVTCPSDTLAVGEWMPCTASGTATAGQYSNTATATGQPPGSLSPVQVSDTSHYFGATPALTIDKQTNGQDAGTVPGVYVLVGSTVNWTYRVDNTGNVALTNVSVVDDMGVTVTCPTGTLAVGEWMTCTASGTAAAGQYSNTATASGDPPGTLSTVQDSDTSHYFGVDLSVSFEKATNGVDADAAPGPLVGVGEDIEWRYAVTNNSNVAIYFSIVDDPAVTISCTIYSLDVGASTTCYASSTAEAGQYENTATLTVSLPGELADVNFQDASHYYGVITGIDIEKHTQGQDADTPTGPLIKIGLPITWDYILTNTGNVTLENVTVMDDNGTPGNTVDDYIVCSGITLQPYLETGYTHTCSDSAEFAVEGQYVNIATVTGDPPAGFAPVMDSDTSHYFGSITDVSLTKLTNGVDVDIAPIPFILVGDEVTWSYIVENTGNLPINEILVTDSDADLVITCDTTVLADGYLEPGVSMTCTATGIAIEGSYNNTGAVEAVPFGFETETLTDSDASAYFGANPSISIEKSTNGQDADEAPGPYIPVGEAVTFQYQVFNNETDYQFVDITVTDDSGVTVSCPGTTLDPGGESMVCTGEATAETGQQALAGHVSATVVFISDQQSVGVLEDSDISHYFGFTAPGLLLTKYTNDVYAENPPGPELIIGNEVTWSYALTNESNAPVSNVSVSDSDPTVNVICPKDSLLGNETMTCSASGEVIAGQYSNSAYASGLFIPTEGSIDSLAAISYYFGISRFHLFIPLIIR